jgi:hypothetical protein
MACGAQRKTGRSRFRPIIRQQAPDFLFEYDPFS